MNTEKNYFLTRLPTPPARLTAEEVAWLLNCQPGDIPILVAAGLLKPLGNPAPNSVKYFATAAVRELMDDQAWLAKMTRTLHQHWRDKNARRQSVRPPPDGSVFS